MWSMLVVGLPALSRPVVSASLYRHCIKRNRRFTDKGRGETKETKRKRKSRGSGSYEEMVWKFVEVLKALKMNYHSVVLGVILGHIRGPEPVCPDQMLKDEFHTVLGGQPTPFCFNPVSRATRNCEIHRHQQLRS